MSSERVVVTRAGAGRITRLATTGLAMAAVSVLVDAGALHAQTGGVARVRAGAGVGTAACPGDLPGIRRGLTNIMQVRSTHWVRQKRQLQLTDTAAVGVRTLGGRPGDAEICRRLSARIPSAYRTVRDGRPRYDIAFFRVGDRYVTAMREARARRRIGVPQMPDRVITYDLTLNRLIEHEWP